MLQYLLNTSFTWLISLIVFDAFLRRESYHGYNRAYLLLTLLMGIFLPMLQWQQPDMLQDSTAAKPIANALVIKQGMIEAAIPAQQATTIDWQQWLLIAYIAGIVLSCILLIREIALLRRYTKTGKQSRDGVWRIVETGKDHSPFSAFRYIFIKSKDDYAPDELRMILTHEEQHGHSLHFLDILLMELIKIIFWFHPLVYIYRQRLLIVHEYQADAAIENTPKQYGEFLVTQAILHAAPALSHSFNRSPIKKRITMLTQHSSGTSRAKKLLVIPLTLVCILCFTKNAFSDNKKVRNGNIVTYRGNKFELKSVTNDTIMVQDPVSGEMQLLIKHADPIPVLINNDKIYTSAEIKKEPVNNNLTNAQTRLTSTSLKEYLLSNMKTEIKNLEDGPYWLNISNIVIDKGGRIVYFDYNGVDTKSPMIPAGRQTNKLSEESKAAIGKKIIELMNDAPKHDPAYINGNPVNSLLDDIDFWNSFSVKDGKVESL